MRDARMRTRTQLQPATHRDETQFVVQCRRLAIGTAIARIDVI